MPRQHASFGQLACDYEGLLLYRDCPDSDSSALRVMEDFAHGRLDFNYLLGSFRMELLERVNDRKWIFCDNAGTMCFYYHDGQYDTSFLRLARRIARLTPAYTSVAQFLQFGCIYGYDTLCQEIKRTDPECYYVVTDAGIEMHRKELWPVEQSCQYPDLHAIVTRLSRPCEHERTACVITGGVDSRTILAHLHSLGRPVSLCISGNPAHVDVAIARELADTLHLALLATDDTRETDWIPAAFSASDPTGDILMIHRLSLLYRSLQTQGITLVFGGVAGEYYKNSFINQDFPWYFGRPNSKRFYRLKVAPQEFPTALCGKQLSGEIAGMQERVLDFLKPGSTGKPWAYLNMGYRLMRCRSIALTNALAQYVIPVNPLTERNAIALVYDRSPYSLEMNRFQRGEVSVYCPQIAHIRTDRGVTCANDIGTICKECVRSYLFLFQVAFRRICRRKAAASAPANSRFPARDPIPAAALRTARQMQLIAPDVTAVPDWLMSRLITVTALFDDAVLNGSRTV